MPVWRSVFAWFGLVPLLWAILHEEEWSARAAAPRFLLAYVCACLVHGQLLLGAGYDAALRDMPALAPTLLLVGYSLVLGLYFGFFGWASCWCGKRRAAHGWRWRRRRFCGQRLELAQRASPAFRGSTGLLASGQCAGEPACTVTGVYGISFVLVAVNALLAGGLVLERGRSKWLFACAARSRRRWCAGIFAPAAKPAATATAVLIQPNLDVAATTTGQAPASGQPYRPVQATGWGTMQDLHCGDSADRRGVGETGCSPSLAHPDLVAWPESPAPFVERDPRLQRALISIAQPRRRHW